MSNFNGGSQRKDQNEKKNTNLPELRILGLKNIK